MVMMKGRPGDQETKDKECNKDVKISAGLGENGSAGCCVKQTGKQKKQLLVATNSIEEKEV